MAQKEVLALCSPASTGFMRALNGVSIRVKGTHKFLGIFFDEKLALIPYIKLLNKHNKHSGGPLPPILWCRQRTLSVSLYRLGQSSLDCGSVIYGSATKTALKMLDPVLHLGLHLASGAFHTSPAQSLYVECNKWYLEHQRMHIDLLYAFKVSSLNNHPCKHVLNNAYPSQVLLNLLFVSMPFSLRMTEKASDLSISFLDMYASSFTNILPQWQLQPVSCDFSFMKMDKKRVPRTAILQYFLSL